ncbi:MAG: nitroreductase family protein [Methylovirgula sp.]|jgi:nitroreductase
MDDANPRHADYPIDPIFIARWSPRAFTGEVVPESDLHSMFEAARWAPSSGNLQPWRFLYARAGTRDFERFLHLLNEGNQVWAQKAGALVIIVSKTLQLSSRDNTLVPSYSHSFDTGTAWGFLALQALHLGWATHGMGGFDKERTVIELKIPQGFRPEAALAIGRRTDKSILPESLAAREVPNGRNPQSEFVFEGDFPEN